MFIPEITCSFSESNRLWRISFINLDYCHLLKNASDRLELSVNVHMENVTNLFVQILVGRFVNNVAQMVLA